MKATFLPERQVSLSLAGNKSELQVSVFQVSEVELEKKSATDMMQTLRRNISMMITRSNLPIAQVCLGLY